MMSDWAQRWNIPKEAMLDLAAMTLPVIAANNSTSGDATQAAIRLAAAQGCFAMWRNNNGVMINDAGRHVRFGLGNDSAKLSKEFKSSDLIGVGPGGKFVATEVKHPKWTRPSSPRDHAQMSYLMKVVALGGIATFATHVDHYKRAVGL